MVHMQCSSECATAQQDLQPAAQALFSVEDATGERREGDRRGREVEGGIILE